MLLLWTWHSFFPGIELIYFLFTYDAILVLQYSRFNSSNWSVMYLLRKRNTMCEIYICAIVTSVHSTARPVVFKQMDRNKSNDSANWLRSVYRDALRWGNDTERPVGLNQALPCSMQHSAAFVGGTEMIVSDCMLISCTQHASVDVSLETARISPANWRFHHWFRF